MIARKDSSKWVKSGACLEWRGATTSDGYALVRRPGNGAMALGHRVAYEEAKGSIPDGLEIDHLCRNRRCCNPDHLEAVTHAENMRRGVAANARKDHCPRGHAYNLINSQGRRLCRTCRNVQALRRYHERKAA